MRRSLLLFALCLALVLGAPPLQAQSGSFGVSVVLEGDELIVAEPNNTFRPGLAWVYRKGASGWEEVGQLQAPDAERADGFGTVLARTGNTLFVAQKGGTIHRFQQEGGSWTHAGTLPTAGITGLDAECNAYGYCSNEFGLSLVAMGDWLLVGEPGSPPVVVQEGAPARQEAEEVPPAGAVHLFRRGADGNWSQAERWEASDAAPGDRFGAALALDEGRALVGAPGWSSTEGAPAERTGRVYEFALEGGQWREVARHQPAPEAEAAFGSALALEGNRAVIGAPGAAGGYGAAYVFHREGPTAPWTERSRLAAFDGVRGDRFGAAVALSGNDTWVGAPAPRGTDTGIVYVYGGGEDGVPEEGRRIRLTDTVTRDAFGDRIVADGGVVMVTATGMHHGAGAVFAYERNASGTWQDRGMLVSPPDHLTALLGEERICQDGMVGDFACDEVELLAFIPGSMLRDGVLARGVRTNDNWGWTDPETGREYALVGRNDGTSFIDITDPTNPVLIGDLPKTPDTPPTQLWRDMKTYRDHVYIVADGAGNHGMQVFDLRKLRDVSNPPVLFEPDVHYPNVASVHNIAINQETGFAYLVGTRGGGETCGGGLHMVDIREPLNPVFAGCFVDERGTHDVECMVYRGPDERYREREVCLLSNGNSFVIADVTDKSAPEFLSRSSHPNPAYMHQGWTTGDHRWHYMNDESDVIAGNVSTTRTLIWDLSDLEDPEMHVFMGSDPASAHNLYIVGDTMYQANYRYGLHIVDISDPLNPVEVGKFDTSPHHEGPGFSGAWSNYPFFESGTILVTSLQEGLFLLKKRTGVPVSE